MAAERRAASRVAPETRGWQAGAVLRPGLKVDILDVSPGGVRIASMSRLKPGGRAELHLAGAHRRVIAGHISRCRVTRLMPLRFEGAVVFDQRLADWAGG